jgi:lipopolysaccharide transport system permease protein
VLLVMMPFYGVVPSWHIVWLPVFTLLAFTSALGVGLWLAAINVQFRDVRYAVPFITQIWLFVSPVVYPSSLLHEPWRTLYGVNPMAGVIDGFRFTLLGTGELPVPMVVVSATVSILLVVSGAFYFRRTEKTFADVV